MIFLASWRIISNLIKSFVDNFENLYQAFVHVSVEFRTIFHSQGPGSKYLFIVNRIFPALATQVHAQHHRTCSFGPNPSYPDASERK